MQSNAIGARDVGCAELRLDSRSRGVRPVSLQERACGARELATIDERDGLVHTPSSGLLGSQRHSSIQACPVEGCVAEEVTDELRHVTIAELLESACSHPGSRVVGSLGRYAEQKTREDVQQLESAVELEGASRTAGVRSVDDLTEH